MKYQFTIEHYKELKNIAKGVKKLEHENARLREALADLERISGLPLELDDPARIKARAALEAK